MRAWGRHRKEGRTLWWPIIARNKKSVTINLREGEGQNLARRLISEADVVVENFRPGTLEKWGLGYEELSDINPGLVMVRVSGYGQTGPYKDQAGFGSIGEAMGGIRHVTGYPDRPPPRVGISLGDSLAATFGALGAVTALYNRAARGGKGQMVDVGIYEAVLALMESTIPEYALAGPTPSSDGSPKRSAIPSGPRAKGTQPTTPAARTRKSLTP
jgi:succinyl-CoA--D-citramalate CoA-transferase